MLRLAKNLFNLLFFTLFYFFSPVGRDVRVKTCNKTNTTAISVPNRGCMSRVASHDSNTAVCYLKGYANCKQRSIIMSRQRTHSIVFGHANYVHNEWNIFLTSHYSNKNKDKTTVTRVSRHVAYHTGFFANERCLTNGVVTNVGQN